MISLVFLSGITLLDSLSGEQLRWPLGGQISVLILNDTFNIAPTYVSISKWQAGIKEWENGQIIQFYSCCPLRSKNEIIQVNMCISDITTFIRKGGVGCAKNP